jgi:hypothetical protein
MSRRRSPIIAVASMGRPYRWLVFARRITADSLTVSVWIVGCGALKWTTVTANDD